MLQHIHHPPVQAIDLSQDKACLALHNAANVAAHVDNILVGNGSAAPDLQDHFQQFFARHFLLPACILILLKEVFGEVNDVLRLHLQLREDLLRALIVHHRLQLRLRDVLVVVLINFGQHGAKMLLHEVDRNAFLILALHLRHNLAQNANEHVHHRHIGKQHVEGENRNHAPAQQPAVPLRVEDPELLQDVFGAIHEGAIQR
mmetsp:Transcript_33930/g.81372  ORF Transcript_33930/g.81372 Transcript_33930/m.81372 type:complete len:202 (+) Transcript_33930:111-716(+)